MRPSVFRHPAIAILGFSLVAALAGCAQGGPAPAARAGPARVRIMSMNMCTDMLVLALAPPGHVASVSYLAREAAGAIGIDLPRGVVVNHGSAEEIVGLKPDLVLAGDFSTPITKRYARAMGARLVEVKTTLSFQDVRDVTRQVAAAVGEEAKGERLIADMDRKLAALAADRPARPWRAVLWSEGAVPGRGTMANAILEAAGAVNIAAQPGPAYTTFGVEQLLLADPDVLVTSRRGRRASLHSLVADHAAVRSRWAGRGATYAETLASCGMPQSADAALELREQLQRLPEGSRR